MADNSRNEIDIDNLRINFERKVSEAEKVVLIPHIVADLDAIGSTIGLSLAVKKLKKVPIILLNDKQYDLDSEVNEIVKAEKSNISIVNKSKYMSQATDRDLFVLSDVNPSYRTHIPELLVNPERIIIIDHHDPCEQTVNSNYKYIDSQVSSASEIVTQLLLKMKVKIPSNVATYLLAGIYLDTKNLTKNTTSETIYEMCKELKKYGADLDKVMEMFSQDIESAARLQELVSRVKIITFKLAIILASNEEEYTTKDLAKAADTGLSYGVDASMAVGQLSDDMIGISARSKGKFNVGEVMREISDGHGGGHSSSAAAQITDSTIEEVGKKLIYEFKPKHFEEQKEN